TSYDKALAIIAKKQIKTEYRKGYLDTFQSEHILETYNSGINHIVYDFLISDDAHLYHWVRVTARIFFWNSDHSVRMISYRKNIDEEKRRELKLIDEVQRDAMTGIYNKTATETLIGKLLETEKDPEAKHAFLILDIDNFKTVNDTMGHAFGDHVICELVNEIKTQFCEQDIIGRVGGDEFAIFMRNIGTLESVKQKLDRICIRLSSKDFGEGQSYYISCSIGMSQFRKDGTGYAELYEKADQALYYTKRHGKASFSVFGENEMNKAYQASRRDLEALLNSATDGITKFACTTPLTVLDFNEKFMELTGRSAKELSVPGFDPIQMIHPEDHSAFDVAYEAIRNGRDFFAMEFRIRKADGSDHPVSVKGIFTGELYEGDYPVFCAIYNKRTN
ncbi:MAG: diguanylate cyclase, partial [Hungatella sp.]